MALKPSPSILRTVYPPPTVFQVLTRRILDVISRAIGDYGLTVREEHEAWARALWPVLEPRGFVFPVPAPQSVYRSGIQFSAGEASVWVGSDLDSRESAIIELRGLIRDDAGRLQECVTLESVAKQYGMAPPRPWPASTPAFYDQVAAAISDRARLLGEVLDRAGVRERFRKDE